MASWSAAALRRFSQSRIQLCQYCHNCPWNMPLLTELFILFGLNYKDVAPAALNAAFFLDSRTRWTET
jgi:hypothetical protein